MNFKRTSILVLLLFAWNTLFGAVGGLLICIHEDLQMHSEGMLNPEEHCETDHISGEVSTVAFNAQKDCVDVELDAVQILSVKPAHSDVDSLFSSPQFVDAWNSNFLHTLRELAPALRAQAPPELTLTSVSVHVVQLTQLRI